MQKLLRVLTLNIWNRSGPWDKRLPLLRAGLERVAADIVGVQEDIQTGDGSLSADMSAGLGYERVFGVAHDLGGGVHFGNSILSRWPITKSEVCPLPQGTSAEHRSVIFAEIASPHGALPFFCTHLNWKFHEAAVRELQVQRVADIVKERAPMTGLPAVLVGDFNAEPEATAIRFLKGLHAIDGKSVFFADTFAQAGEGPGYTFDARKNPFAGPTHEYPRRIDYVFVRGPDKDVRGKPVASKVCFDEVVDGVCATDHFGVVSDVTI